jgi:membrane-bound lytic murein transglycosylase A
VILAAFPFVAANGETGHRIVSRYVLDQDTGGASRVDYFLGAGKLAGERAGVTVSNDSYFICYSSPRAREKAVNAELRRLHCVNITDF